MKRIIDAILFVLFLLFAFLQLNDADPLKWIVIYGVVALVSLLAFFDKYHLYTLILLCLVIFIWAAILSPNLYYWLTSSEFVSFLSEMMHDKPYIEGSREFGGLLLAGGALLYHLWRFKNQ